MRKIINILFKFLIQYLNEGRCNKKRLENWIDRIKLDDGNDKNDVLILSYVRRRIVLHLLIDV